jgi:hypothetical protein
MKHMFPLLLVAAVLFSGCSKKDSNPMIPSNPTPTPVNVTFTMHLESGTQGMIFVASPNEDVKLTKVVLSFPAQQFVDEVTNPNPNTVFPKDSNIHLSEYTGIEGGQQWEITFTGFLASNNRAFTVKINWTVV